jgi:uncharacterized repeat protein (TIGR02543 family)
MMKRNLRIGVVILMTATLSLAALALTGCPGTDPGVVEDSYTVTFDSQGGTPVDAQTVVSGGKATEPGQAPVKDGNSFGGWHKDAAGTNAWVFATDTVTADITLYAKWIPDSGAEPVNYAVSFNSQGGSFVSGVSVPEGGKVTKPADPTREGYTFAGWHKEAAGTTAWDFDTDTVTAAITLYAQWTALLPGTSGLTLSFPAFADAAEGIVPGQTIALSKGGTTAEATAALTVTGDFDSVAWREGSRILGTEAAMILDAGNFSRGGHYITVEVIKDGIPWSQEFKLTVSL